LNHPFGGAGFRNLVASAKSPKVVLPMRLPNLANVPEKVFRASWCSYKLHLVNIQKNIWKNMGNK